MAQTEQFMLRMGTYGPDLLDDQGAMPDYRERVDEVITPKFAAVFDQSGRDRRADRRAGRASPATAEVFATGVVRLDARLRDRAGGRHRSPTSYPKTRRRASGSTPQEPVPFRIEVDLVKIDGEWLVDDFTPVTGEHAPSDAATGTRPRRPQLYDLLDVDPRRLRRRDPRRLAGRDRRPRPRPTAGSASSTRPPRCCSTRTAGRRTTPSCAAVRRPSRRRREPDDRATRAPSRGARRSAEPVREAHAGRLPSPAWLLAGLALLASSALRRSGRGRACVQPAVRTTAVERDTRRRPGRRGARDRADPVLRLPQTSRTTRGRRAAMTSPATTARSTTQLFAGIQRTRPRPRSTVVDAPRWSPPAIVRSGERPGRGAGLRQPGHDQQAAPDRAGDLQGPGRRVTMAEGRRRVARRRPGHRPAPRRVAREPPVRRRARIGCRPSEGSRRQPVPSAAATVLDLARRSGVHHRRQRSLRTRVVTPMLAGAPCVCGIASRFAPALRCSSACPVADVVVVEAHLARAIRRRTPLGRAHHLARPLTPAASLSQRSPNLSRFPQLLSLQTDSFDWLVGNEAWQAAVDAPRRGRRGRLRASPGSRRSSRRSPRSRTSPRRCRSRSRTRSSTTRSTPSTSARRRTSPTPPRSTSPPSSPTTRPARSRARRSSWATSR